MNIFMVHPHDIFSDWEPWTVRIRSFAKEFIKIGHRVKLIYFPLDGVNGRKEAKYPELEGVDIIPLSRKTKAIIKNTIILTKLAGWADIVHFQKCFHYASLPVLIASWIRRKPVHYDWDDWETKIYFYGKPASPFIGLFVNILERIIPKIVDTISVSSKRLENLCLEIIKEKERIFRAPVGADLEKFQPGNCGGDVKLRYNLTSPIVAYIGQLHGGQYAELFIWAAKEILNSNANVTFVIVGGGYRFGELKKLTEDLGIDNKVVFTDSVTHDLIPKFMAAADICVACFEENDITRCKSPLKIAEYLASGKAIVASNVGEVCNMVGGVGILTEQGSVRSLVDGIVRLLHDEQLRKKMGSLARERAQSRYNWKATSENLLRAYEMALCLNNSQYRKV